MEWLTGVEAQTFHWLVWAWAFTCVVSAIAIALTGFMPMSSRESNSALNILGTIDKKLGWMILETPVLIVVVYFYLAGLDQSEQEIGVSGIFVAAFFVHYFHRALIYPQRIKVQGKRMPVMIMLFAMIFYIANGYMIGYYFGALEQYSAEWLADPRFILGLIMFVIGMAINIHSDNILINLRQPGETGYKIPRGGFFRWVSCPNYFGEMLEWIGFAVMSWSLVGGIFALWIALPLIAQATNAHRWYQGHFEQDYPRERKAIIPYLW